MAFDLMHFVQTRIATIDSYSVFFILMMYGFMYLYYERSFHRQSLRQTLWPLMLCGVSFGLGAATKWICLYAGAGLAILFLDVYKRQGIGCFEPGREEARLYHYHPIPAPNYTMRRLQPHYRKK